MDENKIIDNINDENSNLYLTKEAREYLFKTSNWAMGFAILSFIGLGLGVLSGISMMAMGGFMPQLTTGSTQALLPIITGIVYIIFVLIFAVPVWKHYKFAQKAKDSTRRQDSLALTEAMKNLHAYYKWYGVLMIIFFIFYFIAIFGMVGTIMSSSTDGFQF